MAGKLGKMRSLKMTDDEIIDMDMPISMPVKDRDEFPYGARISLTDKDFDKLEVDCDHATEGDLIDLRGMARVTSITKTEHNGKKSLRVELQIEDLALACEDEEDSDG